MLSPAQGKVIHVLLTRAPLYRGRGPFSCDLHVLSAPLTFVLSQDQTLQLSFRSPTFGDAKPMKRLSQDLARLSVRLKLSPDEAFRVGTPVVDASGDPLVFAALMPYFHRHRATDKVSLRFSFQGSGEELVSDDGGRTVVGSRQLVNKNFRLSRKECEGLGRGATTAAKWFRPFPQHAPLRCRGKAG